MALSYNLGNVRQTIRDAVADSVRNEVDGVRRELIAEFSKRFTEELTRIAAKHCIHIPDALPVPDDRGRFELDLVLVVPGLDEKGHTHE